MILIATKYIRTALFMICMTSLSIISLSHAEKELYLVDEIKAVIYGEDYTEIITKSEVERLGLDGSVRTLDDIILERLKYRDAQKYHTVPSEVDIDKQLASVQRNKNITRDQLIEIFKTAGYSYQEGREQFRIMVAINSIEDLKILSRLIVPEKEVRAYYQAHPEIMPANYYIERGVIPVLQVASEKGLKEKIKKANTVGTELIGVQWSSPFWIEEQQIAQELTFITDLTVGTISDPIRTDAGYEIFKLHDKKDQHERSLEERYTEISDILRQPTYERMRSEYETGLLEAVSITRFN